MSVGRGLENRVHAQVSRLKMTALHGQSVRPLQSFILHWNGIKCEWLHKRVRFTEYAAVHFRPSCITAHEKRSMFYTRNEQEGFRQRFRAFKRQGGYDLQPGHQWKQEQLKSSVPIPSPPAKLGEGPR